MPSYNRHWRSDRPIWVPFTDSRRRFRVVGEGRLKEYAHFETRDEAVMAWNEVREQEREESNAIHLRDIRQIGIEGENVVNAPWVVLVLDRGYCSCIGVHGRYVTASALNKGLEASAV